MATYYMDFDNGDNNNDGLSWETAWKSIDKVSGVNYSLHDIRLAKTAAPFTIPNLYATWTPWNAQVVLTSPKTKTIDNCDVNSWNVSPNISQYTNSSYKRIGSKSLGFTIATTGYTLGTKAAWKTLSAPIDGSLFSMLNLSVYMANRTLWDVRICLCSDSSGDVIVNTFNVKFSDALIPYGLTGLVIPATGSISANINSIAIYVDAMPSSSRSITFNNIFLGSELSLNSIITHSLDDKLFYRIKSIDETTIWLEDFSNTSTNSNYLYKGVEKTSLIGILNGIVFQFPGGYGSFNFKNIFGGINKTTNLKDGYTAFVGTQSSVSFGAFQTIDGIIFSNATSFCYATQNLPIISDCFCSAFDKLTSSSNNTSSGLNILDSNFSHYVNASSCLLYSSVSANRMIFHNLLIEDIPNGVYGSSAGSLNTVVFKDIVTRNNCLVNINGVTDTLIIDCDLSKSDYGNILNVTGASNFKIMDSVLSAIEGSNGIKRALVNVSFGVDSEFSNCVISAIPYGIGFLYKNCSFPLGGSFPGTLSAVNYNLELNNNKSKFQWQTSFKREEDLGAWIGYFRSSMYFLTSIKIFEIPAKGANVLTISIWINALYPGSTNTEIIPNSYIGILKDTFNGILSNITVKKDTTGWQLAVLQVTPYFDCVIPIHIISDENTIQHDFYVGSITVS